MAQHGNAETPMGTDIVIYGGDGPMRLLLYPGPRLTWSWWGFVVNGILDFLLKCRDSWQMTGFGFEILREGSGILGTGTMM